NRSLSHALSTANIDVVQVGVQGLPAVPVVDDDHISVTPVVPAGIHDHAAVCCVNRIAGLTVDIDTTVVSAWIVVEAGQEMVRSRPQEGPGSDRSGGACTANTRSKAGCHTGII